MSFCFQTLEMAPCLESHGGGSGGFSNVGLSLSHRSVPGVQSCPWGVGAVLGYRAIPRIQDYPWGMGLSLGFQGCPSGAELSWGSPGCHLPELE